MISAFTLVDRSALSPVRLISSANHTTILPARSYNLPDLPAAKSREARSAVVHAYARASPQSPGCDRQAGHARNRHEQIGIFCAHGDFSLLVVQIDNHAAFDPC